MEAAAQLLPQKLWNVVGRGCPRAKGQGRQRAITDQSLLLQHSCEIPLKGVAVL